MKRIDVYALARFLILVALLIGVVFAGSKIDTLSKRLKRIETRLGGPTKIGCNEKDSIEKVRQSVVRIVGGEGEGSGFAIKNGGIILTNFHVIEFEPSPKVILPDNTFQTEEILMADKNVDLAIIKINKNLPVISWGDPKELNPAEELLAKADVELIAKKSIANESTLAQVDIDTLTNFMKAFLEDLSKAWLLGNLEQRQILVSSIMPKGVVWDNDAYRTTDISPSFLYLSPKLTSYANDGTLSEPKGFFLEPIPSGTQTTILNYTRAPASHTRL